MPEAAYKHQSWIFFFLQQDKSTEVSLPFNLQVQNFN